jgi:predicted NUDIX family NTP pyrophosphohydrolase
VADATDVILAAGPTVVAIAAIGSAVWQQQRGFTHSRALADLDAARAVLDDAAVALQDASAAIVVRMDLTDLDTSVSYDDARHRLGVVRDRVALRFGEEHRTCTPLTAAYQAMDEVDLHLPEDEVRNLPPRSDRLAPAEAGAAPEIWRVRWERVTNAADQFHAGRRSFIDAAIETAGVSLP